MGPPHHRRRRWRLARAGLVHEADESCARGDPGEYTAESCQVQLSAEGGGTAPYARGACAELCARLDPACRQTARLSKSTKGEAYRWLRHGPPDDLRGGALQTAGVRMRVGEARALRLARKSASRTPNEPQGAAWWQSPDATRSTLDIYAGAFRHTLLPQTSSSSAGPADEAAQVTDAALEERSGASSEEQLAPQRLLRVQPRAAPPSSARLSVLSLSLDPMRSDTSATRPTPSDHSVAAVAVGTVRAEAAGAAAWANATSVSAASAHDIAALAVPEHSRPFTAPPQSRSHPRQADGRLAVAAVVTPARSAQGVAEWLSPLRSTRLDLAVDLPVPRPSSPPRRRSISRRGMSASARYLPARQPQAASAAAGLRPSSSVVQLPPGDRPALTGAPAARPSRPKTAGPMAGAPRQAASDSLRETAPALAPQPSPQDRALHNAVHRLSQHIRCVAQNALA